MNMNLLVIEYDGMATFEIQTTSSVFLMTHKF